MIASFKDLLILIGIILVILVISALFIGQKTFDVQLHDTYIVIYWPQAVISLGGPLIVLIYFFRSLTDRFRSAGTNACIILGLVFISYTTLIAIQIQNGFNSAWIVLSVCIVGILILIFRTINVLKEDASKKEI